MFKKLIKLKKNALFLIKNALFLKMCAFFSHTFGTKNYHCSDDFWKSNFYYVKKSYPFYGKSEWFGQFLIWNQFSIQKVFLLFYLSENQWYNPSMLLLPTVIKHMGTFMLGVSTVFHSNILKRIHALPTFFVSVFLL